MNCAARIPSAEMLAFAREFEPSKWTFRRRRLGFLAGSVAALSASLFVFAAPHYVETMTMKATHTEAARGYTHVGVVRFIELD